MDNNNMKKILQDLAYSASLAADEAKIAAQSVGKAVSTKTEQAKCNISLLSLQAELDEIFAEIGRVVFNAHTGDYQVAENCSSECKPKGISALLEFATAKQNEIDYVAEKLINLKGAVSCPNCGRACKNTELFCSTCGTQLG